MPYISVAELPPQPVSLACQHGMRTSARTWRALTYPRWSFTAIPRVPAQAVTRDIGSHAYQTSA